MNPEYVVVLTTLPADADAPAFGQALVEAQLAACVNLLPLMESIYRWEGRVEHETERQLVIKTSRDRVVALWERVENCTPTTCPSSSSCRSSTATTPTCAGWARARGVTDG